MSLTSTGPSPEVAEDRKIHSREVSSIDQEGR
jgi:hypothetical protein